MAGAIEEVRGKHVVIRFEAGKCIHSRNCVLGRPDVFVPNVEGEWIHPDAATAEDAVALAVGCPSGAIQVERLDGGPGEAAPVVNTLHVRENGPLALHAPLLIAAQDAGLRATLCRCGASKKKPYCDGSHSAAGFTATGEPPTQESQPLSKRDGPLEIAPVRNGPLKVTGPLEVVTGTGRTIQRVTQTFLCRCGASSNKPFCDGTHRQIEFRAD
jgi:CDGSH-type Zn-finger protein/uncharacterized Fe-S cluster protein YjdI